MTFDFAQEIANLAVFWPDYVTRTISFQSPNWREAKQMLLDNGISAQLPDYNDDLWQRVEKLVWAEYRRRSNEIAQGKPRVQECAAPIPPNNSQASLEAQVLSMKGPEVAKTLTSLGLSVPPHPTNAGITAMRGKNVLLTHVRHGGTLVPRSVPRETKTQVVQPVAQAAPPKPQKQRPVWNVK